MSLEDFDTNDYDYEEVVSTEPVTNMTKVSPKDLAKAVIGGVLEGNVNPLDAYVALKKMEAIFKDVKENAAVKDLVLNEATKYLPKKGQSFDYKGSRVTVGSVHTYYDFEVCNDPLYDSLIEIEKTVSKLRKEREEQLKLLIPKDHSLSITMTHQIINKLPTFELIDCGEEFKINPPVKKQRQGVKVSFKTK